MRQRATQAAKLADRPAVLRLELRDLFDEIEERLAGERTERRRVEDGLDGEQRH